MKRVLLFLATNLAVMVVLSITASILGVDRFLAQNGLNMTALMIFALIFGFGGAIISLLISKTMAKLTTAARVIDTPASPDEQWLVATIQRLADKARIGMPEVAIYEGAANAFATGAFRDSALVAVSTGLLASMTREEVEAVLGHEISHVSNGDMVTLALIQGVVNTFVIFFARVVGFFVDRMLSRGERDGVGFGYYITVMVCQILFGIIASIIVAWFSRYREFHADAGSASLLGTPRPMIAALRRLAGLEPGALPQAYQAFGITGAGKFLGLFASHPPLEERIAALETRRP